MDVIQIGRRAIGLGAVLMMIGTVSVSAQPSSPIAPGKRCLASESAIMDNLPLGESSHETEINKIEAILLPRSHQTAGWLYTTRNGSHFVQGFAAEPLAGVLRDAGDSALAASFAQHPGSYFQLPINVFKAIQSRTGTDIILASCVGAGR